MIGPKWGASRMETWSPLAVFVAGYVAGAFAAIGASIAGERRFTLRVFFRAWFYWGPIAVGFPMWGYEWLGCAKRPWRVIGYAILIGAAVIKVPDIAAVVRGYLKSKGFLYDDTDKGP